MSLGEALTVVEGLARIAEKHSADCQEAANGDTEPVELSRGNHTKSKQEDHRLENSPTSNRYSVVTVTALNNGHKNEMGWSSTYDCCTMFKEVR